uniref:Unclassified opsin n=1 Tax=Manduca sexta TaxID=7130 RepID=A0A517BE42_MANSE|nr:unclassified opsin [Manduca sexta]
MSTDTCVWNKLFDDNERTALQDGFTAGGLISVILSAWLNLTLLVSNLRHDRSYNNLANFTLAACIRRIVPVMAHLPFIKYIESLYGLQEQFCEFFAFMETFLAVFEVECLTHVCIERYVLAKYTTNGWTIKDNHYTFFLYLCVFFSVLYSYPPLIGLGHYGFDFSCTSCTFDMVLPDVAWQRYIVVIIFALRSIKPVIFMVMMLIWARILETKENSNLEITHRNSTFTRNVIAVTVVNLVCWTPIALIRGWVVFSYLVYIDPLDVISALFIKWAMWIHWISPSMTVVTLLVVDDRLRSHMIYFSTTNDSDKENIKDE